MPALAGVLVIVPLHVSMGVLLPVAVDVLEIVQLLVPGRVLSDVAGAVLLSHINNRSKLRRSSTQLKSNNSIIKMKLYKTLI